MSFEVAVLAKKYVKGHGKLNAWNRRFLIPGQIDHDQTTNFIGNEHIDHSLVSITGTTGLSGGGTIDTSRAITLDTASGTFTGGVKTKMNADGVLSGSMADVGIFQLTGSYYSTTNDLKITGSVDI